MGEQAIIPAGAIVRAEQITPDEQLIRLWLNGLSRHTQRAYRRDVRIFLEYCGKPIAGVTLMDVQAFAEHLATKELVPGSRHRILSGIKSLFAFATRVGFLQYDVARVLRLPACKDALNERILDVAEMRALLNGADTPRNRLMLRLIYVAGLRVSELAGLKWADAQPHQGGGLLTIFGKGGKTRTIRLEAAEWSSLQQVRSPRDGPIFISQRGGAISTSQVRRVLNDAAKRAGINKPVSPHWLRHCHASHALDGGAPIHLVQQTLGHSSVATTSRYLHARPSESSSRFLPHV